MTNALPASTSSAKPVTKATHSRRARRNRARHKEWMWAYLFILPTTVGLTIFSIWPIFQTFYFSFTTWGAFGGNTWSGLKNYMDVFKDRELLQATINTLVFTGLSLLSVPLAVAVAALLNRPGMKAVGLYRTLYFLPVVTLPAAVALMWRLLYSGDYGIINYLLALVGIKGPYWLSDPNTALVAVSIVAIWSSVGYNMVILLAGMQTIPRQYYEAADMDGAGGIKQFFYITVPLLTPSIFFVTVITVINALQMFDLVFLMIGATNPALERAQTVVYLFYQRGFVEFNGGYAAAIAFLLMIAILILTAIQFRLQRRWVHYG